MSGPESSEALSPLTLAPEAQRQLFLEARTANTFTDEPVTDEQVRAIHELVKYAPTSLNQQPLRVALVRSEEARARLVTLMTGRNQEKTAKAPLVAVLAADLDFHEELPRLVPFMENPQAFFADPEAREGSARFNTAIQVGYFILGVRAAGLAAGPMIGFDHAAVSKEFFEDGRHAAVCVVNIGKPGPDAWMGRLPRLEYEEVFRTV
ncbi:malonic semialdehyde reductase [Streptomyces rapamycinicus]|uniref:Malonic semialdehyde reductase n=2 Tax=Streptomyces rapamycinicus TaxID=1226757 RepID=A0A0A0NCT2_STRRN|nr:malonic semialdehyde reductase [Streptomyces rapamycinicus]AGP55056.1 malonic semialdehyde reductase [Streptomyces rapamycinicus NRRL 5491]MBB4782588.1 3-hydroxypropanoate dehydrogenase [Streptomyces rapamycinicus]RLV81930.1 malonic semialdehyde reductase [Streptomyces rapamycinicus NRRL 5491]UTO63083.1 malonic semialdehyde reductase [Streptomyces rapamycinicus]UTP31042.1 malonic semialdehyde reductase [Streptomyces rapamycinicus NRRL 5491]